MKPTLARLVVIVVLAISAQAILWEGACGIRSFYYPNQQTQIKYCEDAAGRAINVLTGVLATLLALLVKTEDDNGSG